MLPQLLFLYCQSLSLESLSLFLLICSGKGHDLAMATGEP